MKITKGRIPKPQKVVVYGPEGIGKSTFAAAFPDPVFIDTEDSTVTMDVARLPKPETWEMLIQEVKYIRDHPATCRTLVIDTLDWAEKLCMDHVLKKNEWPSIEAPGYGKGYTVLMEAWLELLSELQNVIEKGVNVVCTAHAQMRKFEQPDEMGAYDRWELKLQKKTAPLVKEWADMLLFANYKTTVLTDSKTKSKKATGGERVLYTSHHPAWDAKNRITGMPEELPFSYESISAVIEELPKLGEAEVPARVMEITPEPEPNPEPPQADEAAREVESELPDFLPLKLRHLMGKALITAQELQKVCGPQAEGGLGYFPGDLPLNEYPQEFFEFVTNSWPDFAEKITGSRPLPFDL